MKGWLREFRILPVVLVATVSLFTLKVAGLYFDGGFTLGQRLARNDTLTVTTVPVDRPTEMRSPSIPLEPPAAKPKGSWMQEMFNYPGGDITGSVAAKKEPPKEAGEADKADKAAKKDQPETKPAAETKLAADAAAAAAAGGGTVIVPDARPTSAGERALLERLQERRQELDARARELDMRESMLKAEEKKTETEAAAPNANGAKPGAPAQRKEETENARFKAIVVMYETMKPKDAAKIFDRLDIKVLIEMASQIKPQRMAEIMANMSPEAAERLTMEMAAKSGAERTLNPNNLPKIDGKPGG